MLARSIAVQLLKEFGAPFAVAMAWAFWGGSGEFTVTEWIGRFSTAFFFASWLGGQLFRVAKQVRTERSLTGIGTRLDEVVTGLETSARAVAGWASGGNSYAHFAPVWNAGSTDVRVNLIILSSGDYLWIGVEKGPR